MVNAAAQHNSTACLQAQQALELLLFLFEVMVLRHFQNISLKFHFQNIHDFRIALNLKNEFSNIDFLLLFFILLLAFLIQPKQLLLDIVRPLQRVIITCLNTNVSTVCHSSRWYRLSFPLSAGPWSDCPGLPSVRQNGLLRGRHHGGRAAKQLHHTQVHSRATHYLLQVRHLNIYMNFHRFDDNFMILFPLKIEFESSYQF